MRSNHAEFAVRRECLYCARNGKLRKKNNLEDLTDITTLPYLGRLINKINEKDDDWAHHVFARINTYVDLVAPEGKYHLSYMQLFYMGRGNPTQPSVSSTALGKKPDESLNDFF